MDRTFMRGRYIMKMHEIIKKRRLALNLTQEQVAKYLGVTTPAVNKWEKGISYPDISLLPALARLLDTDLNTLLSFQDDLTDKEVALFLNRVSETVDKDGFAAGYDIAISKLKEYPTCDQLVCGVAMLLDGALILKGSKDDRLDEYRAEIISLYKRAAKSDNIQIKEQALSHLISNAIQRKSYTEAQTLLDSISDPSSVDKKQIQAKIYIAQGELSKAAKMIEEKLLLLNTEVHETLLSLMDIAIKDKRLDDAEYIANVDEQATRILDLWEYNRYLAHFQLYSALKDPAKFLKTFVPMIKSLTKKWDVNTSPLYKHIQTKEVDKDFGKKLQKNILESLSEDQETSFLKDSPELEDILKDVKYL